MRRHTLAENCFEKCLRRTRKEQFFDEMETINPWTELAAAVEPYYPNPTGAGRRPAGIERMLRVRWFAWSAPTAEGELYDSLALRHLVGSDSVIMFCSNRT